ncbi:MAG TPA: leucine--tRNA ligase [Candidatus Polarisedimenticolaceae bacterium]|nr:leucine--tRNA ligase [Candidatus Polarisedimenticolaceae bacterium]
MSEYDAKRIEAKWQARWSEAGVFRVAAPDAGRPRFYDLEMLPYPSGRIHMGHVRNYSIGDAIARFRRMRGEQVLHVIGWDAFGLPAENAAIQNGAEPRAWTLANIETMRGQLERLGVGYDWGREIATCLPEYYRWNQWLFLRMLERGVAFRARRLLNWCASCATVLANEQVVAGRCWRCDNPVTRREFEQWFLRITQYAQELLDGIDTLDGWPDRVRAMQRNWIGRSDGARVRFALEGGSEPIEVFTTRIDTIHGATYLALALEHPAARTLAEGTGQADAVRSFIAEQAGRSLVDRFADTAEKLGVFTGRYAINPFSGERIPIWVANFVLMDVGTGAIMSVPAHDERDFAFAQAYGLPVRAVVQPRDGGAAALPFTEDGMVDGVPSAEARRRMVAEAEAKGFGEATVTYRLKDWGVSRQRFWGTPIPVIHCPKDGVVPVPDEDLPVLLPERAPLTGAGGSPLALVPEFVDTTCPRCHGPAARETDTMDTFVDSSWYYFRYCDPDNERLPFDWDKAAPWFPVDLYIGGIEHATMHLIYTRFWTKVMRDLGLVKIDEPVTSLFTQGMVIKDGAKMSKSKGNVVDPDQMIARFGADTTRLFSLFAAPPERDLEWSDAGIEGCARFLGRLWRTFEKARRGLPPVHAPKPAGTAASDLRRKTHQTIRRITDDLGPRMHLNTPVAAIMELLNALTPLVTDEPADGAAAWALREAFETIAKVLAPFAPHVAEELWEALGHPPFVAVAPWPVADPALLVSDEALVVVQVNGKVRGKITLPAGSAERDVLDAARADERIAAHLDGKTIRKTVFVQDRLLNVVAG